MEDHRAGGQEGQRGLDVQDFHPARDSGHRSARQAVGRGRGEVRQTRRRSPSDRQERKNDGSQNFLRRRRQRLREGRRAVRNLQGRKIAARRIELQSRRSRELNYRRPWRRQGDFLKWPMEKQKGSGEWGMGKRALSPLSTPLLLLLPFLDFTRNCKPV